MTQLERYGDTGSLSVPWRDPQSIDRDELRGHIVRLEQAVAANPDSADLWTVLGMAYAMDFRVHPCIEGFERARQLAPASFWPQFKYAEILMRIRALQKAETEMIRATELAGDAAEYMLSRRFLNDIRQLRRQGTQKPAWTRPLAGPTMITAALFVLVVIGAILR